MPTSRKGISLSISNLPYISLYLSLPLSTSISLQSGYCIPPVSSLVVFATILNLYPNSALFRLFTRNHLVAKSSALAPS